MPESAAPGESGADSEARAFWLPLASSVAILVPIAWAMWFAGSRPGSCRRLQSGAAFAGTTVRFDNFVTAGRHPGGTCTGSPLGGARVALFAGMPLAVLAGLALFLMLGWWSQRAFFTARGRAWVHRVRFLPLAAAALDVVENIVTLFGVYKGRGTGGSAVIRIHPWAAWLLPIVSWPKLVFYAVTLIGLLFTLVSAHDGQRIRSMKHPTRVDDQPPEVGGLGISCSGGGIRAGSIALGVLSSLEAHTAAGAEIPASERTGGHSILDRATYLTSVSGGGYTAGAWTIARAGEHAHDPHYWPAGLIGDPWADTAPPPHAYDDEQAYEGEAADVTPSLYRHIRTRQDFLSTGRGGLAWAAIRALASLCFQMAVLAATIIFIAWPVGRLSRTWFVYGGVGCRAFASAPANPSVHAVPHGDLGPNVCGVQPGHAPDACASEATDPALEHSLTRARCFLARTGVQMPIGWTLTGAPVSLAVLALAVFLPTLIEMRTRLRQRIRLIALALAGAGALMGATLLGLPVLLDVAYPYVTTGLGIGLLVSASSAAGIGGIALKFAKAKLSRRVDILGKLLVAVAMLLFGIVVAGEAAIRHGIFAFPSGGWLGGYAGYVVLAAAVIVLYVALDPRTWSLHVLYRDRIRDAFATTRSMREAQRSVLSEQGPEKRVLPLQARSEKTLDQYPIIPSTANGPIHLFCCSAARAGKTVTGIQALSFVFGPDEVVLYEPEYSGRGVAVYAHTAPTGAYVRSLGSPRTQRAEGTVTAAVAMSGAAVASSVGRLDAREPTALFAFLNLRLGVWMPHPGYVTPQARLPRARLSYLIKEITGYFALDDHHLYITDGGHRENLGLVELLRRRCRTMICVDASGDKPGSFNTLREAAATAAIEVGATIDLTLLETGGEISYSILPVKYSTGGTATIIYLPAQMFTECEIALRAFCDQDTQFPHYSTGDQFLSDEQFTNLVKFGRALCDDALKHSAVTQPISTALS